MRDVGSCCSKSLLDPRSWIVALVHQRLRHLPGKRRDGNAADLPTRGVGESLEKVAMTNYQKLERRLRSPFRSLVTRIWRKVTR